jgi:hypothetical protein
MPASTRRALLSRPCPKGTAAIEYEIAELRVWDPEGGVTRAATTRIGDTDEADDSPAVEVGPSREVVLSTERNNQP